MKRRLKYRIPDNGEILNYWTVLDNTLVEIKRGHYAILVKCKCGKESLVRVSALMTEKSKGCPCRAVDKNRENRKYVGDISDTFWSRVQKCARLRKKEFNITKEFAWQLFLNQDGRCALSGLPLTLNRHIIREKGKSNITASLDRINSSLPYTENNVQWVHKDVNKMKQNLNEMRFKELCKLITEYDN